MLSAHSCSPLYFNKAKLLTLWRAKERRPLLFFVMSGWYSSMTCSPAEQSGSRNSEQHGCNPTLDYNVGCNGRVVLSGSRSTFVYEVFFIQNRHGQWVSETKGFVSLCLWQFSMSMCNVRLIGQPIKEKNGYRQMDEWDGVFFILVQYVFICRYLFIIYNRWAEIAGCCPFWKSSYL